MLFFPPPHRAHAHSGKYARRKNTAGLRDYTLYIVLFITPAKRSSPAATSRERPCSIYKDLDRPTNLSGFLERSTAWHHTSKHRYSRCVFYRVLVRNHSFKQALVACYLARAVQQKRENQAASYTPRIGIMAARRTTWSGKWGPYGEMKRFSVSWMANTHCMKKITKQQNDKGYISQRCRASQDKNKKKTITTRQAMRKKRLNSMRSWMKYRSSACLNSTSSPGCMCWWSVWGERKKTSL